MASWAVSFRYAPPHNIHCCNLFFFFKGCSYFATKKRSVAKCVLCNSPLKKRNALCKVYQNGTCGTFGHTKKKGSHGGFATSLPQKNKKVSSCSPFGTRATLRLKTSRSSFFVGRGACACWIVLSMMCFFAERSSAPNSSVPYKKKLSANCLRFFFPGERKTNKFWGASAPQWLNAKPFRFRSIGFCL